MPISRFRSLNFPFVLIKQLRNIEASDIVVVFLVIVGDHSKFNLSKCRARDSPSPPLLTITVDQGEGGGRACGLQSAQPPLYRAPLLPSPRVGVAESKPPRRKKKKNPTFFPIMTRKFRSITEFLLFLRKLLGFSWRRYHLLLDILYLFIIAL